MQIKNVFEDPVIGKFLIAFAGVVLIVVFIRLLKRSLGRYIKDQDHWYKTRKGVNLFGYLLAIAFILVLYSDKLGGVTVVLGVASAGIALSLQEVIVSIAGWLTIISGNIYKTGDRVKLGGVKGDVIDLGVLRTTIMEVSQWVDGDLYNGRIVRVANSFVFKEPVYNYSTAFPFLWDEIKLPIKFGSDYQMARQLISEVAKETVGSYSKKAEEHWETMVRKFLIENASTDPMVTLAVNDNWAEFTLRYVVDYRQRRTTKDKLYTSILNRITASEGAVQLASATFQVVELPELDVNIKK